LSESQIERIKEFHRFKIAIRFVALSDLLFIPERGNGAESENKSVLIHRPSLMKCRA
jgi:hypothetical protein